MSHSVGKTFSIVALGVIIGAVVLTFAMARGVERSPTTGQPPVATFDPAMIASSLVLFGTPRPNVTAVPEQPVYSESEALARTMAELPAGIQPTQIVVRLVSEQVYVEQFRGSLPMEPEDIVMGPVWIVGIVSSGITDVDVFEPIPLPESVVTSAPPVPIDAVYFAWDANRGVVRGRGTLALSGTPRSLPVLEALHNEALPIVTASPMPGWE